MAPSTTGCIAFLSNPLDRKAERKLLSFRTDVDDFRVHGREIYWLCRIRSSEFEFSLARLEKELGIQAIFRNTTTVRKIAVKYGALLP
jgi:hypothetical protein